MAHVKAGSCGQLSSASVTIIKLANLDTLRVLELCNDKKDFQYDEHGVVSEADWASSYGNKYDKSLSLGVISFQISGARRVFDCLKIRTCYGIVSATR